jgi:hypothetical protein
MPPIGSGSLCGVYERERDAVSISYVAMRIFGPATRNSSRSRRTKMVHFLASDEKYRDLIYGHDDRSYRTSGSHPMGDYRFGRTQANRVRVRARNALRHAGGYLKNMIEAIASVKLRRMERELDLRAVRVDRSGNDRAMRESPPAQRS